MKLGCLTPNSRWNDCLAAAVLVFLIALVFGQTAGFDFINYQDPAYTTENTVLKRGLSGDGFHVALTQPGETNLWQPLAFLSHALDNELWGIDQPGRHHLVSVFWHLVASLGLLALLRHWLGSVWLALIFASIWAVHPQRVQSVAWISQRGDVLGGAFFFWAWWAWGKAMGPGDKSRVNRGFYVFSLLLFACAALAYPVTVVLPLLLLVSTLIRGGLWQRSLAMLTPFLVISMASVGLAQYFQSLQSSGAAMTGSSGQPTLSLPHVFTWYLEGIFLPINSWINNLPLWVYPPTSNAVSFIKWGALFALFAGLVLYAWKRQNRMMAEGLSAFVLLLFSLSGISSAGFHTVADHYSYLPHAGLIFVFAGLVSTISRPGFLIGFVFLASLAPLGWMKTRFWKDSETLFQHEISINPRSDRAPIQLGIYYLENDEPEKALELFRRAEAMNPRSGLATRMAGEVYEDLGNREEAKAAYMASLSKFLQTPVSYRHLVRLALEAGDTKQAQRHLAAGLERFPDHMDLLSDEAALIFGPLGDVALAVKKYRALLEKSPLHGDARQGLGVALLQMDQHEEGITILMDLLEDEPGRQDLRDFLNQNLP